MSVKHPIIAITGSSGAGTNKISNIFNHFAWREKSNVFMIDGNSFHRYDRDEMELKVAESIKNGGHLSHFGPEGNDLNALHNFLKTYSETGKGQYRRYLHTINSAREYNQEPGTFTPWRDMPEDTDLLVYQGLHGAYISDEINISEQVDYAIGVTPIVNLEWIQKIHNDTKNRGYSLEAVQAIIEHRLHDYVHYITPQFSHTDINFQRIPLVDTSNPFADIDVPECEESMVVIRFRHPEKHDFPALLHAIDKSFMSRRNTLVVPGGKMDFLIEFILNPIVHDIMEKHRQAKEY